LRIYTRYRKNVADLSGFVCGFFRSLRRSFLIV
jgi:hypothetical protein